MLRIENILFPTDFTECAESAFAQAAHLADRYDAVLHVLNVLAPYKLDPNNPMSLMLQALQSGADLGGDALLSEARVVHSQLRVASPGMGIIDYADEHDIDLIVMGTHGRRGLDRLFLGSVAEEVLRGATCPVMTVHASTSAGHRVVRRVLVPVDFSEHASLAITYGKEVAASYGATLVLMHVVEEQKIPTVYGVEPVSFVGREVVSRSEQGLARLANEMPGAEVPVERHVVVGNPGREIGAFASEHDIDLIVISTHGLSGMQRLLLGSVTERVVRSAPCPVFIVKSFGRSLLKSEVVEAVNPAAAQ